MQRRALLSTAALSLVGMGNPVRAQQYSSYEIHDVVVVGAGLAGLCAAVSARENGARSVLILEKGPIVGGHSAFASGTLTFVDPKRQLEGVRDSVDEFVRDAKTVGGDIDEPMVRKLASESGAALEWLEDCGVKLSKVPFRPFGGIKARCLSSMDNIGAKHYVEVMNRKARSLGIRIRLLEPVKALKRRKNFWELTTLQKGTGTQTVYARSVILATGGFVGNVMMRTRYDRRLDQSLDTTSNPQGRFFEGATGDGHILAVGQGAVLTQMDKILLMPYWNGRLLDYAGGEIYVNSEGKRFVDETQLSMKIAREILKLPDRSFYVITDSKTLKGANFGNKLTMGGIHKSDSVKEMAAAMRMSPKVLHKTLDEFNLMVKEGKDPVFGRTLFMGTLDTPPFYWGMEKLLVHECLGGVRADTECRVLKEDGSAIPGLFAAGELVGGIWGSDRMGGCALLACIVQGREAGKNASAYAN